MEMIKYSSLKNKVLLVAEILFLIMYPTFGSRTAKKQNRTVFKPSTI